MSKHTPGPWIVGPRRKHKRTTLINLATRDGMDSGSTVAEVFLPQDASIVAAAPQLVEALDSLIGWAVMRSDWAAAGKSEPTDHPIQRARAALKSAGVSHE